LKKYKVKKSSNLGFARLSTGAASYLACSGDVDTSTEVAKQGPPNKGWWLPSQVQSLLPTYHQRRKYSSTDVSSTEEVSSVSAQVVGFGEVPGSTGMGGGTGGDVGRGEL
jgi:hypothetical protein